MTDVPAPLMFVDAPPAPETANVLAYGPSGSGKTVFACSGPGPVLVVNAEGPNALAYARKLRTDILEVKAEGRSTLHQVLTHIRSGADPQPKTVVVDSVYKVYSLLLEQLGGSSPKIQHYGQVNKDLADFVRALRDLPVNVVLVAHERIDQNDDETITRPLTGGQQLPEIIMGEVDIAAYCAPVKTDDGVKYMGQFVEARGRRAKDRSGALGPVRDLDLGEVLAAYREGLRADESDLPFSEDFEAPLQPELEQTEITL